MGKVIDQNSIETVYDLLMTVILMMNDGYLLSLFLIRHFVRVDWEDLSNYTNKNDS